ncbi:multiprotein-bridging factor 1 family protein [Nocardia sp. NPDC052566]|uniref:multiprotein-bridging factor 1 family protein n=1 Tax=Nocardia sp. NPDC052566 TaxID=3364330 RepID=UPI0037CBE57F
MDAPESAQPPQADDSEDPRVRVGRAVVRRRIELKMDQSDLAREAQVDAKTVRYLERGERWPRDSSRAKIERALDWIPGALDDLLGNRPSFQLQAHAMDPATKSKHVPVRGARPDSEKPRPPLSAAALQILADQQWVVERIIEFSAEDRETIKRFIDELGRKRFDDWDRRFVTDRSALLALTDLLDHAIDVSSYLRAGRVVWASPTPEHEAELEARDSEQHRVPPG